MLKRSYLKCAISGLSLVAFSNSLAYADNDADIKNIARVERSLDNLEARIDRLGQRSTDNSYVNVNRAIDRLETQVGNLSELSAPTVSRYNELIGRFEAKRDAHSQRQIERETAISSSLLSEASEEDDAFIQSTIEVTQMANLLSASEPALSEPGNRAAVEAFIELSKTLPPVIEKARAIRERYKAIDPRDLHLAGPAITALVASNGIYYDNAETKLNEFYNQAANSAASQLATAAREAQQLFSAGEYRKLVQAPSILHARAYIENVDAIFSAGKKQDPELVARYKRLEEQLELQVVDLQRKAFDEIVASNEPIVNRFEGGELDEIIKLSTSRWGRAYPGDEVLSVRVPDAEWYRIKDKSWKNGKLVERDIGLVDAWVIVRFDNLMATQHSVLIEKDYRRAGRISLSFGARKSETPDPATTILISKL